MAALQVVFKLLHTISQHALVYILINLQFLIDSHEALAFEGGVAGSLKVKLLLQACLGVQLRLHYCFLQLLLLLVAHFAISVQYLIYGGPVLILILNIANIICIILPMEANPIFLPAAVLIDHADHLLNNLPFELLRSLALYLLPVLIILFIIRLLIPPRFIENAPGHVY